MKNRLYDMKFMIFLPFVITILATLILLFYLPMDMPMQFGSDGGVNWSLNKYIGVWIIPIICYMLCKGYQNGSGLNFRVVLLAWFMLVLNLCFLVYIAFIM